MSMLDELFKSVTVTPTLQEGEVHVWAAHPQLLRLEASDLNLLTSDEKHRVSRFHFEKDRWTFKVGRILVRSLAGQYKAGSVASNFRFSAYGKPHLADGSLHFNISHSGGCVVVAFSKDSIGVDIEFCNPEVRFKKLSRRFFSLAEQSYLQEYEFSAREFYRIWTRKEAFIKADGRGVQIPLDSFSVLGSKSLPSNSNIVDTRDLQEQFTPWYVANFNFAPDMMGAICQGEKICVKYFHFDTELLRTLRKRD